MVDSLEKLGWQKIILFSGISVGYNKDGNRIMIKTKDLSVFMYCTSGLTFEEFNALHDVLNSETLLKKSEINNTIIDECGNCNRNTCYGCDR